MPVSAFEALCPDDPQNPIPPKSSLMLFIIKILLQLKQSRKAASMLILDYLQQCFDFQLNFLYSMEEKRNNFKMSSLFKEIDF